MLTTVPPTPPPSHICISPSYFQVTVVHINSTSKNAADDKLRQSLRRFAQTYCAPATIILISGDGNFAVELSDLRHRHKFHIICLHNAAASSALLGFADETHRFDLFAEDLETFTLIQVLMYIYMYCNA